LFVTLFNTLNLVKIHSNVFSCQGQFIFEPHSSPGYENRYNQVIYQSFKASKGKIMDIRRRKLADVLVNYSVAVQPGDWVMIRSSHIAAPLVNDVVEKVVRAGGNPDIHLRSETIDEIILKTASDEQLGWLSPLYDLIMRKVDVLIDIWGTENTRSHSNIDPKKQRIQQNTYKELFEILSQRIASGEMRWVGTQYPCPAYAQDADMSLREFEDFVYAATFVDQDDPVAEWVKIHDEQQRLVDWLKGKKEVKVHSPHADLVLSIQDRSFINSAGKQNMPSGEIFTSPVEDSVNGWIEFTYPAITGGREVEGIRLEFSDGKVVRASAEKNEEYLLEMLDSDAGARYLGEFAIGTNYGITRFTKSILFDEKIGGTIHLALGMGFPEAGSKNTSNIHWDMICDMRKESQISVDDHLFYQDGKFMV
jgi:aminopeptidase